VNLAATLLLASRKRKRRTYSFSWDRSRPPRLTKSDCGLGGFRGTTRRTPFSRPSDPREVLQRDLARFKPAFPLLGKRAARPAREEVVIATSREDQRNARPRRGGLTPAAGRALPRDVGTVRDRAGPGTLPAHFETINAGKVAGPRPRRRPAHLTCALDCPKMP
jgi:hypothetical protein